MPLTAEEEAGLIHGRENIKSGDFMTVTELKKHDLRACKVPNRFTALVHREEDLFVAECPEIGTASQGYTPSEAIANLKEATELYLEEIKKINTCDNPFITKFEVDVNA